MDELVDVANMALDRIGVNDPIASIDDNRPEAAAVKRRWKHALAVVLEDYPFPFATRQQQLAELANVKRHGWSYVCALPGDCVAPRAILVAGLRRSLSPATSRIPFDVQANDAGDGQVICLDVDPADIDALEYTALIETVKAWPALFTEAYAWKLAAELALAVKKDRSLASDCLRVFRDEIGAAYAAQLRGRQEDPELDAPSILARS